MATESLLYLFSRRLGSSSAVRGMSRYFSTSRSTMAAAQISELGVSTRTMRESHMTNICLSRDYHMTCMCFQSTCMCFDMSVWSYLD